MLQWASVIANDLFWGSMTRGYACDAVNDLSTDFAGLFVNEFSLDHKSLTNIGKVKNNYSA